MQGGRVLTPTSVNAWASTGSCAIWHPPAEQKGQCSAAKLLSSICADRGALETCATAADGVSTPGESPAHGTAAATLPSIR